MPKGVPNKRYMGEFKQQVIEDMRDNNLGYNETMRKYEITAKEAISKWERIYLEEGPAGLYVERRGRGSKIGTPNIGRPRKMDKKVEEDLIAEVQRLRMENAYLKKLNALVQQREESEKKTRLR
jgi:transposase-like protein